MAPLLEADRVPAVAQAALGSLADMLLTGPVAAAVVAQLGLLSPDALGALNSLRASCKVRCLLHCPVARGRALCRGGLGGKGLLPHPHPQQPKPHPP
jgi:hypothetical protein